MRAFGGAQVLQELDVMTTTGKDCQHEVRIGYAGDLFSELPRQLYPMLHLEAEDIPPERDRRFEIADGYAGVRHRFDYSHGPTFVPTPGFGVHRPTAMFTARGRPRS